MRSNLSSVTTALPRLQTNRARAGQRLWYRLYFFEINRKSATGNSVMFILLHWYCHRGFGCGKMITFTLKIFNIFGDVYTRDGTISLGQRDASAQIVVSHNYPTQVWGSIPFTPSVVTKWHDRHRYLSIHHMPHLMSLSSPPHCSKTLMAWCCVQGTLTLNMLNCSKDYKKYVNILNHILDLARPR